MIVMQTMILMHITIAMLVAVVRIVMNYDTPIVLQIRIVAVLGRSSDAHDALSLAMPTIF